MTPILIPRRVFRSPLAVAVWWAWALIALASLADLAVQGRDRFSLLVALGLVTATGVMYVAALRPRIIADDDGLVIVNPLRDHQIRWPAVASIEAAELVRIRCEWPADAAGAGANTDRVRRRVIYAWAVHSSRRGQAAARARAARHHARHDAAASRGTRLGVFGGASYPPPGAPGLRYASSAPAATGSSPAMDAEHVAAELTELAQQRNPGTADPSPPAQAPAARWSWPSVAAIGVPAITLLIAALA